MQGSRSGVLVFSLRTSVTYKLSRVLSIRSGGVKKRSWLLKGLYGRSAE
jgi:hypothetical protein